jgi:hypothetical protein
MQEAAAVLSCGRFFIEAQGLKAQFKGIFTVQLKLTLSRQL